MARNFALEIAVASAAKDWGKVSALYDERRIAEVERDESCLGINDRMVLVRNAILQHLKNWEELPFEDGSPTDEQMHAALRALTVHNP
jgi:hypothetical protein